MIRHRISKGMLLGFLLVFRAPTVSIVGETELMAPSASWDDESETWSDLNLLQQGQLDTLICLRYSKDTSFQCYIYGIACEIYVNFHATITWCNVYWSMASESGTITSSFPVRM